MLTTITLSPAQVQGMYATPVTLMPAPGSKKVIRVNSVTLSFDYNGTVFAAGDVISVRYIGGTNVLSGSGTASTFGTAVLTTAADTVYTKGTTTSTTTHVVALANTGIEITNATQAFTGGTSGSVKVIVDFNIINL